MTDPTNIRDTAAALVAWPSLAVVVYICRSWCRRFARRLPVNSTFSRRALTWRIVRAMSWRAGLFLLIGIPVLFALGDALVGGISFAMLSYPLVMLSVWQHSCRISRHAFEVGGEVAAPDATTHQQLFGIARALDGGSTASQPISDVRYISQTAYDTGLQAKRFRPTIIEGIVLTAAAVMLVSVASSIALPVTGAAKRRVAFAQKQSAEVRSQSETVTAANPSNDITLPMRVEARKLAGLLKSYGLPADEANYIAFRKMPGGTWWESDLLPRFNAEQRSILAKQLQLYLDVARESTKRTVRAELAERAIIILLQRELKLSNTECFDLWQAGLLNQTEDWWSRQIDSVVPAKQKQINDLRKALGSPPSA